nr:alpha- and gamma-adaptin-binding protein p34-like isoform X2 [Cherax quadricarinatus]
MGGCYIFEIGHPVLFKYCILEVECVPEPTLSTSGIQCWHWELENKYYTASVQIAAVSHPQQCLPWIHKHGEALLVYCDSTQRDVLERLNELIEIIGDFEPEVQLLVCEACTSEQTNDSAALSRIKAQQWCIANGWELIELNPVTTEQDDFDEDDDFPESWGFKRIRQALHAHTWSNLNMKDCHGSRLTAVLQSVGSMEDKNNDIVHEADEMMYSRLSELALNDGASEHVSAGSRLQDSEEQDDDLDSLVVPTHLEECLDGEDGDFESLFSNFEHLKRTAATLPPDQRRDYAEKVAVAFWRAIGGDDDEVNCSDAD